jgi:hypothetical protein
MKLRTGILTAALCWSLAALPHPVPARGDEATPGDTVSVEDADIERWWGIAGTVICGVGIRLMRVPGIGLNPWVLAPTIGGCLLGLIDAFTSTNESAA